MSDENELLVALQAGDSGAFSVLVEEHHRRLVGLAQSVVTRRDLAEEVVQDTWMAVIRGIDGFEHRSSLKTWIYRICLNRAHSAVGKEYRTGLFDTQDPAAEATWFTPNGAWASPVEPWPDAADARLDAAALLPRLRTAIDQLPEAQRLVVTLRDVEGLSSSEVCDVLSISEANERVLLHRGRNRLRSVLDGYLKGG